MANVYDAAAYILSQISETTAMKLQKLVYYSQAWHIAWSGNVLFPERIEAWADGPVSPDLFTKHKGLFRVSRIEGGRSEALTDDERDSIGRVLEFYGKQSSQWLSDLTHKEEPWIKARGNIPDRALCKNEITPQMMETYYASL